MSEKSGTTMYLKLDTGCPRKVGCVGLGVLNVDAGCTEGGCKMSEKTRQHRRCSR